VAEYRFFEEGTIPEYTTAEWYADRESAPHLEQDLHVGRLYRAADFVKLTWKPGMTVVDLGAGDGGLLSLLGNIPAWGFDLQQSNVDASKARKVDVRYGNVFDISDEDWGDIVIATEMIEHLVDPHGFVRFCAEHCEYLVASSPGNETPDDHYGFHTWGWDMPGYRALLEENGIPWVLLFVNNGTQGEIAIDQFNLKSDAAVVRQLIDERFDELLISDSYEVSDEWFEEVRSCFSVTAAIVDGNIEVKSPDFIFDLTLWPRNTGDSTGPSISAQANARTFSGNPPSGSPPRRASGRTRGRPPMPASAAPARPAGKPGRGGRGNDVHPISQWRLAHLIARIRRREPR
jgi:hypothetical protein